MVTAGDAGQGRRRENREQFPTPDRNCEQGSWLLGRGSLSLSLLVFTTIARGTG